MNAIERSILREPLRKLLQQKKYAWGELKRQIFDFGFQDHYPRQDEFIGPAMRAIALLPKETREVLRAVHVGRFNSQKLPDDETLNSYYVAVMIDEIVRRAGIAAYRTENW